MIVYVDASGTAEVDGVTLTFPSNLAGATVTISDLDLPTTVEVEYPDGWDES